ncbi:MmgE/PrpD family protein [Brenneria populi subsp. brevivirga]|uniref:MmgE/PrpD family protein n=1 Tax=Brenneria populi TaxID=1505588 RepID=UPI002E19BBB3|nr:MmgE/PrpD family protein [Brenneria populi subsp. brevivirga]
MTVIEAIAAWCAGKPPFSQAARQRAREAIIDTLACLYAGRNDFSSRAVRQAWSAYQPRPAAVCALINATAAHAIDYDDNFAPGMSHASAVLVPALLAIALEEKRGGGDLIDAYLIGLQAQAFVGSVVGPSHYTAGWHGTSTVGCIGTAAGVAWLKRLDQAGIARTLSIAVSLAGGVKGQFGTPLKPFHAGMAARNAVEAATLAAAGMSGRLDIIEGEQGFYQLFSGKHFPSADIARWPTLSQHVIETDGVLPKKHPCCGSTHRVLDAIGDLRARHTFSADDVVNVAVKVGIANRRNLAYPLPQNEMQARFSMPYCVSVLLHNGALSVADFTPERVADQAVADKLGRVGMTSWSEAEEDEGNNLPHIVTITLKDGRRLSAQRLNAKGDISEPFSDDERQRKFADCCAALPEAGALYRRLTRLEQETSLAFLRVMLM